jgi:DNA-binding response OmpR family regulator
MDTRIVTTLDVLTEARQVISLPQLLKKGQHVPRILLFSRDRDLLSFLRSTFRFAGYSVSAVHNRISVRLILLVDSPSLAVVNVLTPTRESLDILQMIRAHSKMPILALLDGSDPRGLEIALDGGADDYLVTPFQPRELRARASALIRRSQDWESARAKEDRPLVLYDVALDSRTLEVNVAERHVKLALAEFTLLHYLMANHAKVTSQSEILAQVWGNGMDQADILLDSTVTRLRERIEPDPGHPRYIIRQEDEGFMFHPWAQSEFDR